MRRTNQYTAHTPTNQSWVKDCACEWLAACCAYHNEINYHRRQAHFDTDNWENADTSDLYDKYAPVVGTGTAQQLTRKNAEAWRAFDELEDKYDNPSNTTVTNEPSPPGYWGNRNDGYELRSVVRNDKYDIEWGADKSTLTIPVGKALNDKYDIPGRGYQITLELRGDPRWRGEQGRLDIAYDEVSDCFRVNQPVTVQPDYYELLGQADFTHTLNTENTEESDHVAAIDVGANNTLTIVTDEGDAAVFHARPEFEKFQARYTRIAEMQARLPPFTYSSQRIRKRYRTMYGARDHQRDAAIKQAAQWLLDHDVSKAYVGDLSDVLDTHWSAEVNSKTHNYWSHGQLTDQLENTLDLAGIDFEEVSEAGSSSTCPHCSSDGVTRHGDSLVCPECGVESHSDVVGAALILADAEDVSVAEWFRPMARPALPSAGRGGDGDFEVTYFQWDDHEWTLLLTESVVTLGSLDQRSVSEPESSEAATTGCVANAGILRL